MIIGTVIENILKVLPSPMAILHQNIKTKDMKVQYISQEVYDMFDCSEAEDGLEYGILFNAVSQDDKQRVLEYLRHICNGGFMEKKLYELEYKIVTKDNNVKYIKTRRKGLLDKKNECIIWYIHYEDMTSKI